MFSKKAIWWDGTSWFGFLTFLVSLGTFLQGQDFIVQYPAIVAGIGIAVGIITVILQMVTKWLVRES